MRVCVIDDDVYIRHAAALGLRDHGYEVAVAGNGAEALAEIALMPPDIVVTDVLMPDGDALEMLPRLRADHPDLPIIAVSGGGATGNDLYLKLARQFGAHECLIKPFTIEDLVAAIERVKRA